MQRFWIRYLIFIVVLAVFTASGFLLRQEKQGAALIDISKIPLRVGDWRGEEIAIEKDIKGILETDMVLMRRYVNPGGEAVDLAIVYYKDSRVSLHLPESCLMGQGSKLTQRKTERIDLSDQAGFDAMRLITKSDRVNYLVLYYFETGKLRTSSYFSFRKQMLLNKLKGKSAGGALVRFSIPVAETDISVKLGVLKEFISEINNSLVYFLK